MSADLRYLSYVRRGLARSIGDQADSSDIPRSAVASVDVAVVAAGEEKPHTMAVRGPGSAVGLAPGEVVRVDPPDGATDHAANMFASVELRTADLPWLFTPARPRGERLIPWLVLVVVEDREGNSLTADGSDDAQQVCAWIREKVGQMKGLSASRGMRRWSSRQAKARKCSPTTVAGNRS